jgi:MFS family permease
MAAVAIAPLLPLLLLLVSLALIVRRLVDRRAYLLAFATLFYAGSTTGMFVPLRIDHHNWQLAFLALGMAGIADPRRARGGLTLGVASALSLTIGLEMLIYLAIGGAAMALFWVVDATERERLRTYAIALAGGTALGFLLFASNANRQPVCDALSPVWLGDALLGGALLFLLAWRSPADWRLRLLLAALAGLTVAGFHALAWPNCLQRLEGVSPEVEELWLSYVREARPIYKHGWRSATQTLAIPVAGLIGWTLLAWFRRRDPELLRRILPIATATLAATLLLAWQTRTGPAAQMLGLGGSAALIWLLVPKAHASRSPAVRVLGVVAVVLVGVGAAVPLIVDQLPEKKATKRDGAIGRANRLCNSTVGFKALARQPKGTIFTFVDTGPRLITVTHHNAITGPYHRNGEQIGDVMKAFRGSEAQARAIIVDKYRADYVMICPHSSTTTIFLSDAPQGFFAQLNKEIVPSWLTPVDLPKSSPFKLWRVAR